jgi:hypothetical protein
MKEDTIDRREFTVEAVMALLSGVTISISACGGSGGSSPTGSGPPPGPGDAVGSISANHGHRAVVTAAQLAAGNAVNLNIAGDAGHPHFVNLPADAIMAIQGGMRVSVQSSTGDSDNHSHMVTFNTQGNPAPGYGG